MGVVFLICEDCEGTFPDCGPYSRCDDCGIKLCQSCAKDKGITGFIMSESGFDGEDEEECAICPYCSGEEVTNDELLYFALEKLGMTEEDLTIQLKEKKKS